MHVASHRIEDRDTVKVAVDLSSLDVRTPAQEGVTENISARGVRVVTGKEWKPHEMLNIRSLMGSFRSRARVVYCEPLGKGMFAVGLQLFATMGHWQSPSPR
ncbi:MAG TPA: PilZ domain-containing protein [Candidatus Acidoferrum sp.]|jgi:hypothetical protein